VFEVFEDSPCDLLAFSSLTQNSPFSDVDTIIDASDKSNFHEELERLPYNQLGLLENQLYWADINRHVDIKEGIF